ncbi:MAG TPA: hypothetical protein VNX21_03295 [Candidatus Thermoplasmatota archaeon]|nr:hypothetical protein [Candidatus Thermoplasmatota archaeon]
MRAPLCALLLLLAASGGAQAVQVCLEADFVCVTAPGGDHPVEAEVRGYASCGVDAPTTCETGDGTTCEVLAGASCRSADGETSLEATPEAQVACVEGACAGVFTLGLGECVMYPNVGSAGGNAIRCWTVAERDGRTCLVQVYTHDEGAWYSEHNHACVAP